MDIPKFIELIDQYILPENIKSPNDHKSYYKTLAPLQTCTNVWDSEALVAICRDCSVSPITVICLDCFKRSDHHNHLTFLVKVNYGFCDCGNTNNMKKESFCELHREQKFPKTQIPEIEKEKFRQVIEMIIENIPFYCNCDKSSAISLLKWLNCWIRTSSLHMKVIADVFIEKFNLANFLLRMGKMYLKIIDEFTTILIFLFNYDNFDIYLLNQGISLFPNCVSILLELASVISHSPDLLITTPPFPQFLKVTQMFLLCIKKDLLKTSIHVIDWIDPLLDSCKLIFDRGINDYDKNNSCARVGISMLFSLSELMQHIIENLNQEELVQFIRKYVDAVLPLEGQFVFDTSNGDFVPGTGRVPFIQITELEFIWFNILNKRNCIVPDIIEIFITKFLNNVSSNNYEPIEDKIVYHRYFGDEHIKTSFSLGLHSFAHNQLLLQDDMKKHFETLSITHNYSYDDLAIYWALLPLRFIGLSQLNSFKLVKMDQIMSRYLSVNQQWVNINNRFKQCFLIVQTMLGLSRDKDAFLKMICYTCGLDADYCTDYEIGIIEFNVLMIICGLIFDRYLAKNDQRMIRKLSFISIMTNGPQSINDLLAGVQSPDFFQKEVIEDVLEVSRQIAGTDKFVVRNASEWTVVAPWVPNNLIHGAVLSKLSNGTRFFPFPEWEDPIRPEIDLKPCLNSRVLFALIFQILSNTVHFSGYTDPVTANVCSGLLVRMGELFPDPPKEMPKMCCPPKAKTLEDLIKVLPNNLYAFVRFQVSYRGREATCVLQMLECLGKVSERIFHVLDPDRIKTPCSPRHETEQKDLISSAKKQAIEFIRNTPLPFDSHKVKNANYSKCNICGKKDNLWLPVYAYKNGLPKFIGLDVETVLSLFACPHCVHISCVPKNQCYICKNDNFKANCFVPMNPTPENAQIFLSSLFPNEPVEKWTALGINTLTYEVHAIEMRHRMNPFALDNANQKILLEKTFLCVQCFNDFDSNCLVHDPIASLFMLLMDDYDYSVFLDITRTLSIDLSPKDLYVFLRCCRIIARFLYNKAAKDWDDELSAEKLKIFFGIENVKEIVLEKFKFKDLDENLMYMILNSGVTDTDLFGSTYYDMLTGDIIHGSRDHLEPIKQLRQHVKEKWHSSFSILVPLQGGKHAIIIDGNETIYYLMPLYYNPYRTELGILECPYVLSRDVYDYLIDCILSGYWLVLSK